MEQAHRPGGWEGQGGGDRGRLLGPQAGAQAMKLLVHAVQWLFSLGSGWGRGFWGVTTSPEDKERSCLCSRRGVAPARGHLHTDSKDRDSGHLPAVLGWKGRGLLGCEGTPDPKRGSLSPPSSYPVTPPCLGVWG